ncbi:receptor-interacting serine/threonine-protein kinase 1 isoform X2 [Huso huso]|uniref:Receptor-interacting serine/threonine-protein kinase 1 isoform X2 n=1 Tax=Huso huso TaxID=61971 RepID=A0ABR1A401_HUSHU
MALDCIRMSSKEFTKKEFLDYGGFGKVSLCLHETHGFVVLKTVYTGPLCTDSQALLEEGEIMNRLNHERIVKLLGVILEEGNHALVMEYIPKGNLLMMLKNVSVPISIKGRIILEIIEGMAYLNQNSIIHKDLKPENILIDKDVHVKIADLGLATCKAWSKLTKEESRRQSRSRRKPQSNAGTLYYMAPEHLDSINSRSTEKSDIYSFGIVVWVILANKEPYENAHNEDHVYYSVCKGDRPDLNDIPVSAPEEITNLMKLCWDADPTKRPTFTDCFKEFSPFYKRHLTKDVERDLENLRAKYEGPEDFLEKMKSLTLETIQDHPSSLRSSQELPVETSIEDIIFSSNSFTEHSIQMDAAPGENLLQQKLDGEYKYHKYGSRMDQQESQHASGSRLDPLREERNRRVSNNPSYEKASTGESAARNKEVPERERYLGLSSPEEPKVFPNTSDTSQKTEVKAQPFNYPGMYNSPGTVGPVPGSPYPYGMGAPFPYNPEFQRMNSLPAGFPVPESDATQGMPFSPITLYPPQDKGTGNWIINNASGVQIGNYNHLSIGNQTISSEPCQSSPQSNNCPVEMIQMFENNPVEEEHLQLLRDNLGRNWKHCARKLGIREPEIEVIDHDYERDGLKEKVYQMLEMWKMREGQRGTTVGKLLRALQDSKGDLLNKLLQLCKNMQSP